MPEISTAQQYRIRKGALWTERESFFNHWRELSDFMLPRTGRFFVTDRNKGEKRHGKIINETATYALRVLAAGLMSGMTSPARPWFRLAVDKQYGLENNANVKEWLNTVTEMMRAIFSRSNTYRALHSVYEELGCYGTAASIVLPDFEDVLRHYTSTAGEYAISTDYRGEVNALYRCFDMTIEQVVGEFVRQSDGSMDWSRASATVKNLWDGHRGLDSWLTVLHVIEPRDDRKRNQRSPLAKHMRFASCYLEEAANNDDKFLNEGGFKRFPGMAPRWHTAGGDIYGNSPGMEALGSVKQIQHGETRKSLAIDYGVKPPLQMPAALKNQPHSTLPGGVAFFDATGPQNKIQSMFEPRLDINAQQADISRIEGRIRMTMYTDLFLMIQNMPGVQPRNVAEIAERHEEKLLMLGPTLERLHNELLKRKIDIAFDYMIEADIVPPPPEELEGVEVGVEFVSMLAQAQRAVGIGATDRLVQTVGTIATFQRNAGMPVTAMDKLDTDAIIEGYADALGADPDYIVANDRVAIIRDERAKQQQQAAAAAAVPEAAGAARDLSQADPEKLQSVMGMFSGYT